MPKHLAFMEEFEDVFMEKTFVYFRAICSKTHLSGEGCSTTYDDVEGGPAESRALEWLDNACDGDHVYA